MPQNLSTGAMGRRIPIGNPAAKHGGTPAGPALKQDFPDVDRYARIQNGFDENLSRGK